MTNPTPTQSLSEGIQPRADRGKIESPLEELFIEQLEKYLSGLSEIFPQYEVQTLAGKFRLDFLLTIDNKKIGFECDGKYFHDEWRDEWRDALILGSRQVDIIYRFRGKDLYRFLDDCIYLIYYYDKKIFNDRYFTISQKLISNELKSSLVNFYKQERNIIGYKAINQKGEEIGWLQLIMERRSKDNKSAHWNVLFNIAQKNPGLKLEELMEIRKREIDGNI